MRQNAFIQVVCKILSTAKTLNCYISLNMYNKQWQQAAIKRTTIYILYVILFTLACFDIYSAFICYMHAVERVHIWRLLLFKNKILYNLSINLFKSPNFDESSAKSALEPCCQKQYRRIHEQTLTFAPSNTADFITRVFFPNKTWSSRYVRTIAMYASDISLIFTHRKKLKPRSHLHVKLSRIRRKATGHQGRARIFIWGGGGGAKGYVSTHITSAEK